MTKDPNYIAALEKAITEKYGEKAALNPKAGWDPEKEARYQEEVKQAYRKEREALDTQQLKEIDGVLVSSKLFNKNIDRQCQLCKKYSFYRYDDLFLTKYSCCQICYLDKIKDKQNGT